MLIFECDRLKEYFSELNFKFIQSKEDYNKKSLDFLEQVKVNIMFGKIVKKYEVIMELLI